MENARDIPEDGEVVDLYDQTKDRWKTRAEKYKKEMEKQEQMKKDQGKNTEMTPTKPKNKDKNPKKPNKQEKTPKKTTNQENNPKSSKNQSKKTDKPTTKANNQEMTPKKTNSVDDDDDDDDEDVLDDATISIDVYSISATDLSLVDPKAMIPQVVISAEYKDHETEYTASSLLSILTDKTLSRDTLDFDLCKY
jgi:hypothetical protein